MAERLVAKDFLGLEPVGKTSDKAGILAEVRGEPRPTSLKITAISVQFHGDTAIALGTEEDTDAGATKIAHRRWLDTWRKSDSGWLLQSSAEIVPQP